MSAHEHGDDDCVEYIERIVYLGGLGDDDDDLSAHLRSRREVEGLLGEDGVPVTVLRAAIVVGHGGISWEITRQLVKNLPAMVVPKWVGTRTQPIALDDVVRYLAGVVDKEEAFGRVFEIGGSEQLTYLEMMRVAAEIMNGRRVPIITVPVLTPRLSSYWLALVTDVDVTTATSLVGSMSNEVVVTDTRIRDLVPFELHWDHSRNDETPACAGVSCVRPLGFEPRTNGLRVHCSAIELETVGRAV